MAAPTPLDPRSIPLPAIPAADTPSDVAAARFWSSTFLPALQTAQPTVFILRGVAGAGKTTLVNMLRSALNVPPASVRVCSIDGFFASRPFDAGLLREAHEACKHSFLEALRDRIPIIFLDNSNTRIREYQDIETILASHNSAIAAGSSSGPLWPIVPTPQQPQTERQYAVFVVEIIAPEPQLADYFAGRSSNRRVPAEVVERQATRFESDARAVLLPAFIPPSALPYVQGLRARHFAASKGMSLPEAMEFVRATVAAAMPALQPLAAFTAASPAAALALPVAAAAPAAVAASVSPSKPTAAAGAAAPAQQQKEAKKEAAKSQPQEKKGGKGSQVAAAAPPAAAPAPTSAPAAGGKLSYAKAASSPGSTAGGAGAASAPSATASTSATAASSSTSPGGKGQQQQPKKGGKDADGASGSSASAAPSSTGKPPKAQATSPGKVQSGAQASSSSSSSASPAHPIHPPLHPVSTPPASVVTAAAGSAAVAVGGPGGSGGTGGSGTRAARRSRGASMGNELHGAGASAGAGGKAGGAGGSSHAHPHHVLIDSEALPLPAEFEGPHHGHGHGHGHGHHHLNVVGRGDGGSGAGAGGGKRSRAGTGSNAHDLATTSAAATSTTATAPAATTAAGSSGSAGDGLATAHGHKETEDNAAWSARATALLQSEQGAQGAQTLITIPPTIADFSSRLWEACQNRLARRVVYLAVFLYGESRERLKSNAASKPRFETTHCDHLTIKHLPTSGDISKALMEVVGTPVHLVTQRCYTSAKRGVQAVTVAWPDLSSPPSSGRRETRAGSELMESDLAAALAGGAHVHGSSSSSTSTSSAADAALRLLHSPSLGPRPGPGASGVEATPTPAVAGAAAGHGGAAVPALPSLADLGSASATESAAPAAATSSSTSARSGGIASGGRQPQNAKVRAAIATTGIDKSGVQLSANRHPHVVVSVRNGVSPLVARDMIKEAEKANKNAAAAAAAGSAVSPTTASGGTAVAAGSSDAASTVSGGSGGSGPANNANAAVVTDVSLEIHGRIGMVVADGPECRHRSYILNQEQLRQFLFGGVPGAAATTAATTAAK